MFSGVIAMALFMQSVVIPQGPLRIAWNQSPNGPGSTMLWSNPPLGEWQVLTNDTDYLQLRQNAGIPSLLLNTRSGVIETGRGQSPGAPNFPEFILTNSTITPFMLEFTCDDAVTCGRWRGNGNPLIVTITPFN